LGSQEGKIMPQLEIVETTYEGQPAWQLRRITTDEETGATGPELVGIFPGKDGRAMAEGLANVLQHDLTPDK